MTRNEVLDGVRECVATVLNVDAGTVAEDARIIADLGADSLDLLDLTFQLEQKFRIKVSPRDMEKRAAEQLGDTPLEVDGMYTPEALAQLRKALPDIPAEELADGLTTAELPRRLRVSTMADMVVRLLEENNG